MSMDSELFDITLLELAAGHIVLDRLGAPREIEEDGIVRECEIAERIKFLHAGPQIKSAPSTITAGFVFGIAAVCALLKLAEKVGWA